MSQFKVNLQMAGKEYKQRAGSVELALSAMGLDWSQIKAKGVVTITKDGQSYEHFFPLHQLKKLFGNKMTRAMWSKRLEFLLGEGKVSNEIKKLEV